MTDLDAFIAGLPKAELHVHHVGSASPRIVAELAARHEGASPVPADPALLADYFTFTDFGHFIEVYLSVVDLVRDAEDLWTLTYEIARELAAQQVRYAELTLTPFSSIRRGIPAQEYCDAVEDARRRAASDHGVQLTWCFDIPGEAGLDAADVTLDVALRLRPDGLVSFGLGGPEQGVGRQQFAPHFAAAKAAGLHSVPHAGESTGPETVWDALTHLGAERIGHGIASARDPRLLDHLAERGIALEVCPTSNLRTAAVGGIGEHPLPLLLEAGVPVTLATDDPGMFHTDLNAEYLLCHEEFGLGRGELADLARAGVHASFASPERKAELLDAITAVERAS